MRDQFPPVTIDFGAVRVAGVPGLPLIGIVIAIAFQFPEARWLLALGVAAGAAVAAALIVVRARPRRGLARSMSPGQPGSLFLDVATRSASRRRPSSSQR